MGCGVPSSGLHLNLLGSKRCKLGNVFVFNNTSQWCPSTPVSASSTGDRIQTTYVNELEPSTFTQMYLEMGAAPFDLCIDDGLHGIGSGINVILFGLQGGVRAGGWIVVEDIESRQLPAFQVVDALLKSGTTSRSAAVETAFIRPALSNDLYLYVIIQGPV